MNKFLYKKTAGITVLSASMDDFMYKNHAHQEFSLGVTLRGIQQYHLDSKFQSSHKNGVMLFNPDQSHDGHSRDKSGIDYVMVYIEPEQFADMTGRAYMPCFLESISYDKRLRLSILNLAKAVVDSNEESYCYEKLANLGECFNDNLIREEKKDNHYIQKIKEIIRSDVKGILNLDDMSQTLNISKYKLIRLFNAGVGISPYQYFISCKVEHAKGLIESTRDVYAAVSECNYTDLTHLNRHFKSIYGTTAYEYLQSI